MSHFTVGVFVPRNIRDIEDYIALQMKPYDEGMDYPKYERPCWCVGREAQHYGECMALKLVGTWPERRELFHARADVIAHKATIGDAWSDPQLDKMWKSFNTDFERAYAETADDYRAYHPDANKPRPDCETCHGTGIDVTTYNPKSKWDWYRIGGRWDGDLTENPLSSGNGFNFDKKHETLANNSLPVAELLERHKATGDIYTFFAVLTPDGVWHERGKMGWFAMVHNEQDGDLWQRQLLKLYRQYAGNDVVLLDAHI